MRRYLRLTPLLIIPALFIGGWLLFKDLNIPVLSPSGEVAAQQKQLILTTIFLSALVVLPVYALLVIFAIRYRSSNKKRKYTPEWGENRLMESLWWGIPFVIIAILAFLTVQTSHSLDPYRPLKGADALNVQVVALRWKWLFLYPEQKIATLNQLPLPVDRPVHFTLTADAPMSAFWIPALGSQIYTMNGMASQLNLKATKTGTFTGYTTNINGTGYADMTFTTKVLTAGDYKKWSKDAAKSKNLMDETAYHKLAEPSSLKSEATYKLASPELFDAILRQSMGHDSHMRMEQAN